MGTLTSFSAVQGISQVTCASFTRVTQLASGSATGFVCLFARNSSSDQWALEVSWQAHDSAVIQVVLAPSGNILASTDGWDIKIWQSQAPAAGAGDWKLQSTLTSHQSLPVLCITATADDVPRLAAAAVDGPIRIYEPVSLQTDCEWHLHSLIHPDHSVGTDSNCGNDKRASIAWKPSCHADLQLGVPAMLVIGHPAAGAAVHWYASRHGRWCKGPRLSSDSSSLEVAAVAWAPANGRPAHLVAVAYSSSIAIWHLSGPADNMEAREAALLKADGFVQQLEFHPMGSWLAVSVQGGTVQLCRPVLDGSWQFLTEVKGKVPDAESDDAVMSD